MTSRDPSSPAQRDLTGRRALVTGGASGIGRATARRLADLGAAVVIADVSPNGPRVAAELGVHCVTLDVGDPDAWKRTVTHVVELLGGLDLLHLNAGVNTPLVGEELGDDPLRWVTAEGHQRTSGVNVDGVVHGVIACLPHLRESAPADIVVTGSIGSVEPIVADPLYTLSKYAVVGFIRALAPTLAGLGVRAQVLCPGGVDTPIVAPDARTPGRPFADPSYAADAFVTALDEGTAGDVWVAPAEAVAPYRYTYAPIRPLGRQP